MKSFLDITYGKLGLEDQKLDIHIPDNKESYPLFIYIHGGGIENGDKYKSVIQVANSLVDMGIAMVSINYRMYPNAKYPDYIEDCAEAVAWVFNNFDKYGTASSIFVGGGSAGGYLSMMLCFDKSWLAPYGISPTDITGFIHDAGQPTTHFNILKYEGVDSRRVIVDERAPIYHIGVDNEYSPMIFIVSDNDMENRYEQTMLVISTLKHFGHSGDKVKLKVMNGTHCKYVRTADENGVNVFAKLSAEYIYETVKEK